MVQEHGIGSNNFLEYLQLKSSVQSKINIRTTNLFLSPEISQLVNIHSPKRLLSQIYKIISHSDNSTVLPSNKWEQDLSITPDADFWTQICKNIYLMTKNANLQLIQYKLLNRTHYTGQKMFKMGFTSETCAQCTQNCPDTYIHATCHCTPIKLFWKEVIGSLSDFMDCRIPLSPSLCLLGDTTTLTIDKTNHRLLLTSNYRQENYPHKLEIKKHHTPNSLEKFTHRPHLTGILTFPSQQHSRTSSHLA